MLVVAAPIHTKLAPKVTPKTKSVSLLIKKIKTKLLSPSVSPDTRFAMFQDEIYVLIGSKSGCDKATIARTQEDAV